MDTAHAFITVYSSKSAILSISLLYIISIFFKYIFRLGFCARVFRFFDFISRQFFTFISFLFAPIILCNFCLCVEMSKCWFLCKDQESQLPAQILRQDKGKVALIKSDHCSCFGKTML